MGLEIVATLFALKLRHPNSIYLLRGNHECSEVGQGQGRPAACCLAWDCLLLPRCPHAVQLPGLPTQPSAA